MNINKLRCSSSAPLCFAIVLLTILFSQPAYGEAKAQPLYIIKKKQGPVGQSSHDIRTENLAAHETDIGQVLQTQPSLLLTDFGGYGQAKVVQVRGSSSYQVPIFLDDIPIHSHSGKTDLAQFDIETLSSIEVVRGMTSSKFGSGAMGGVLNLNSKTAKQTQLHVSAGSFGHETTTLLVSLPAQTQILLQAKRHRGDFTFLNDRGTQFNSSDDFEDVRKNNDGYSQKAQVRAQLAPGVEALIQGATSENGNPGTVTVPSLHARTKTSRAHTWLKLKQVPLAPVVYGVFQDREFSDPEGEFNGSPYTIHQSESRLGTSFNHSHRAFHSVIDWSGGIISESLAQTTQDTTISRQLYNLHSTWKPRPFLSNVYSELSLHSGLIVDNQNPNQHWMFAGKFANKWLFLKPMKPSAISAQLHASVGTGYRFPSLAELYDQYGLLYPNPDLKPEQGIEGELGLTIRSPFFELNSVFFARHVTNLIRFDVRSSTLMSFKNVGKAYIYGFEQRIATSWSGLELDTQLSMMHGTDVSTDAHSRLTFPPILWHISAKYPLKVTEEINIMPSCSFMYENRSIQNSLTSLHVPDKGQINAGVLLNTPSIGMTVSIGVKNLTNQMIQDRYGYPLPGRVWKGAVSFAIN